MIVRWCVIAIDVFDEDGYPGGRVMGDTDSVTGLFIPALYTSREEAESLLDGPLSLRFGLSRETHAVVGLSADHVARLIELSNFCEREQIRSLISVE